MVTSIPLGMKGICTTVGQVSELESKLSNLRLSVSDQCRNVNVPWPTKGMGDGDYIYAFQNVVMPIATEFDPDFVIGL